jgi:hypothetical protein
VPQRTHQRCGHAAQFAMLRHQQAETIRPGAIDGGATAGVREAEQAEAGLWTRLAAGNPRVRCRVDLGGAGDD